MWDKIYSVFMTLSSLLGGDKAIQRPKVQVKLKGSSCKETFLYDSGAQVSLLSKKSFRKISINLRPKKLNFKMNCSGVSGNKLKILGCYVFKVDILGKEISHPFFVCDIPGQKGVIGIDLIKKFGLGLDVITNQPYFIKSPEATLTKDTVIPARSRAVVNVRIPKNVCSNQSDLQILQVNIPSCRQIYIDELLLQADTSGIAKIYLTNVSKENMKLQRGQTIGQLEKVNLEDLNPFDVEATTPLVPSSQIAKIPIPKLDLRRRMAIEKAARLDHLPAKLKLSYLKLLFDHHACISLDEFDLGKCNKGAHAIPTKVDCPPSYQKQFPLPIEHEREVRRQVLEWLKIGIIRPCESEWNSSLFLVAKKQLPPKPGEISPRPKAYRIVQDLRALNKITLPSNVRLPEIHECLDRVAQKKPTCFSGLDLRSGYFQLPIQKESQLKTAFTVPGLGQQFCFNVTSQGLTSAPASFARTMQRIFSNQIAKNDVEVYLDDVLAYSKDHKEMLTTLELSLKNLINSGMKINLEKCQFGVDKLTYLGFELNKEGYKPDPIKSEGITKVVEPSTLKGVRSFLGMANFYRLLIPNFTKMLKPLTRLTCKNVWPGGNLPKDAKEAFKKCQQMFTTRPFLSYPDFNLKFHLYVDASLGNVDEAKEGGLAGCLVQYPNNDLTKPVKHIGFCSRGLAPHEKNYSAHLIETASIIFAVEFFEKYLRCPFVVHTDHKPITTVREGKVHKRTLERFREILANYDFKLEYTRGEDMPSDFMSRHFNYAKIDSIKFEDILSKELKVALKEPDIDNHQAEGQTKNSEVSRTACSNAVQNGAPSAVAAAAAAAAAVAPPQNESRTPCTNEVQKYEKELKPPPPKMLGASVTEVITAASSAEASSARAARTQIKANLQNSPQEGAQKVYAGAVENKCALGAPNSSACIVQGQPDKKSYADAAKNSLTNEKSSTVKGAASFAHKLLECVLHVGRAPVHEKKKILEADNPLKKLKKFCAYEVSGKIVKSFDMLNTSRDQNPELLKKQQSIDPFIQSLLHFLKTKELPKLRYRNLVKRWGPVTFIQKGIVMVRLEREGYPTRDVVIAPADRYSSIIAEAHGSWISGHEGMEKTAQRILRDYWFPGVFNETKFFVDNCPVCQKHAKKSTTSNTYLKPLKQTNQPFERVHMDLFGPMKTPGSGKKYIMTMTDAYSKYSIFKVIENKKATTVAKCFFENWVGYFGSPLSILTDKGSDFDTSTLKEVCNILQIDKKLISTKHPQSNSQSEILNKRLAKYLKSMREKNPLEWEKLVTPCQYAYNLSIHTALKNSPFAILFGVEPNSPLNAKGFVTQPIYGDKYHHNMGLKLKAARQLAQANNMTFREKYTKNFDEKVKPHSFHEGQLVYLHRPEMAKINPKISSPWFGPYVILQKIGEHNCLIQDISNRKTKFINTNRLRSYNSSIEDWTKLKNKQEKMANSDSTAEMQSAVERSAAAPSATPAYAEFDETNDVVILNPNDPTPMPIQDIKTEVAEEIEQVEGSDSSSEQQIEPQVQISPKDGAEGTSKNPDSLLRFVGKTLSELSSTKKKTKKPAKAPSVKRGADEKIDPPSKKRPAKTNIGLPAKKIGRDISDTPPPPPRRSARGQGGSPPNVEEEYRQLELAEKGKRKH